MTADQETSENSTMFNKCDIGFLTTSPSEDMDWMIRPCRVYKEEYKECKSIRGRLQQYFIYGKTIDCNQWTKDYSNCNKWTDDQDAKAKMEVIKSECERKTFRLKAHYNNKVWTERNEPPKDWNKPLPEWLVKRDSDTYLARVSEEFKDDNNYTAPMLTRNCTIL